MKILLTMFTLILSFQAHGFEPMIGDEATYETTLPTGTGINRRVIESYDATKDRYEIAIYVEAQGKTQRKTEWSDATKLKELYISDLQNFCQTRAGQIITVTFEGQSLAACNTVKDNGVLKQSETFVAGLPFGIFHSLKKSPLHPKAGAEVQLLSFKLQER